MPPDAAAGGAGRGDGDTGLGGDLAGAWSDGDLDGFAGVGQPGWTFWPPAMIGPRTGTRCAVDRMEQRRLLYAGVPCSRRALALPGSGRLAG